MNQFLVYSKVLHTTYFDSAYYFVCNISVAFTSVWYYIFLSFSPLIQDVTSVEQFCQDITKEDRPQPFILSLENRVTQAQQVFVIIERQPLTMSSLLKAVDFCFKTHFVMDIAYQVKCKGAWEFLQSEVYKIGTVQNRAISAFRAFYSHI